MIKVYQLKDESGNYFAGGSPFVVVDGNGNEVLFSYFTEIMARKADGRMTRAWDDWTWTTGRHIKAFCGLCKKDFLELKQN